MALIHILKSLHAGFKERFDVKTAVNYTYGGQITRGFSMLLPGDELSKSRFLIKNIKY